MQVYSLRGESDTVLTQFPILRPGLTVMNSYPGKNSLLSLGM